MKRLLALLLVLAMALGLAACGNTNTNNSDNSGGGNSASASSEGNTSDQPSADDGEYRTFVYGTDTNSTTFDPDADLQTDSGAVLKRAIMEPLWTVDSEGKVVYNKLAESAEWSDDYLTLTIKLREGVKFSNGNDLTAEDVLFTLNHMAETSRTTSMVASIDLANSHADGDYTVVLTMNSVDAALETQLASSGWIMDEESVQEDPEFSWLVGTGPYKIDQWNESVDYVLVRNENYWGDKPLYDEIDIRFYAEESTRYSDLQAGNLDAAYLTEATYINNLDNGVVPDASLVRYASSGIYAIHMSIGDGTTGAFEDINIRKAFAHCLDIETMVETLGEGIYEVASGLVGESCWAYENLGVYEYDEEAAKEYLAQAGYSVDNPITIGVYCESTAWSSAFFEAAQAYAAKIGINLDLSGVADFPSILPVLLAGEQDMSYGSIGATSGIDPASLMQQLGPQSDNAMIRVSDPEMIDLFVEAQSTMDQEKRVELYHQFMEAVYDNYLVIPVCLTTINYGVANEHTSYASAIDISARLDVTLLTD